MENNQENEVKKDNQEPLDTCGNDAIKSMVLSIVIILIMYILSVFIGD